MALEDEASAGRQVVVQLPRALLRLFPGAPLRVALEASTVDELLAALDQRWPGMRDRLCDARPAIRKHINVFIEGEHATLATRLAPGTRITILTAISGG